MGNMILKKATFERHCGNGGVKYGKGEEVVILIGRSQ
jgi:hypothetical protein